jgi:hypothetical protein
MFRRKRTELKAEAPTQDATTAVLVPDVPAGTDLDRLVGSAPTTRRRGRLRRRARHLRGVREVLLRDLGGMVFEVHRAQREGDSSVEGVVTEKLTRLAAVDRELRDLEAILEDRRGLVVREPGISGTCPNCGELYGSEARFCWACGTPVAPGAHRPPEALGGRGQIAIESTAVQLPPPPPPAMPPPPPPPAA